MVYQQDYIDASLKTQSATLPKEVERTSHADACPYSGGDVTPPS
jgi:hypothetical protein